MSGGIKSKVNGKLGCILLADAMCQSIAPSGRLCGAVHRVAVGVERDVLGTENAQIRKLCAFRVVRPKLCTIRP